MRAYHKTQRGLINKMCYAQRLSSKRRGHPPPAYTFEELYAWLTTQMEFFHLFNAWVASDYDVNLKPSCDRLDDTKPYTFSNIQITTWKANNTKGCEAKFKPVNQLTLEGVFIARHASLNAACKAIGKEKGVTNIEGVCNGRNITAYKHKWEWS